MPFPRQSARIPLILSLCAGLLPAAPAVATDYVVDTATDIVAEDGSVSLREAVMAASTNTAINADVAAGELDGDTISFNPVNFLLNQTITLGVDGEMLISDDLSIDGNVDGGVGLLNITISAAGLSRIFNVDSDGVVLSNLTLSDGLAVDTGGAITISAASDVTLNDVTVSGSAANGPGGGGIYNAGLLTINGGSFTDNHADVGVGATGGAIHNAGGALVVNGGSFTSNTAAASGGALYNGTAEMVLDGSAEAVLIDSNTASGAASTEGGGGIYNNGGTLMLTGDVTVSNNVADGVSGSGGGIFSQGGNIDISGATIDANLANRAGGGIELAGSSFLNLNSVTLSGNLAGVAPAVPSPGNGGGLHVSGTGAVNITASAVSGNQAATEGGGLWNNAGTTMTLTGTAVLSNTAAGAAADNGGGGIFNAGGELIITGGAITQNLASQGSGSGGGIFNDGGMLSVTASVISGNSAARAGGGIEDNSTALPTSVELLRVTIDGNAAGPTPGNGGGVHISGAGSNVSVDRSTVSSNTASNEGAGLWNASGSSLSLVNSTVSGNSADTDGGGLFNQPMGNLSVLNTTIAANLAAGSGGGLLNAGTASATNAIFGDNSAASGGDISGSISANTSIIEDGNGATVSGTGNLIGVDAGLGPLADNGGGTQTHELMDGSPAIDAGDNASCAGPEVGGIDQRGASRDQLCDIGAYEVTALPVVGSESTTGGGVTVKRGDTDVSAVGFSLENNSGEAINMNGFSGRIGGNANPANAIAGARLYLDADGDGTVDSGDTEITEATVTISGRTFSVDLVPSRSLASGTGEAYLLAVDIGTSVARAKTTLMLAGLGLLPFLMLLPVGGLSRRGRALLLIGLSVLAVSSCGGGGGGGGRPSGATLQFTVTDVDATGAATGDPVTGINVPFDGPLITIR